MNLRRPDLSHVSVRYSDLAAALYFDDGCVQLIGSDAIWRNFEPTLWRNGQKHCRSILERIPVYLLQAQVSRPADAIPKPKTTLWQRLYASLFRP